MKNEDSEAQREFATGDKNAGKIADENRRPWFPPDFRIMPLDMTGAGSGAPGNEHTPSTWTSMARTFDNRPPS